jgi:hypothetical protein
MMKVLLTVISTGVLLAITNIEPPTRQATHNIPGISAKNGKLLVNLITVGESGKRRYNAYNRGSQRCSGSQKASIQLTSMSIGQIMAYQRLPPCHKSRLYATGFYQIINTTMKYCVSSLKIPLATKYTPQVQDKIFTQCLAGIKRPPIERYIKQGVGLNRAAHAVAEEWAAFKSPLLGRGVHDNKGNNKATIPASKALDALKNARSIYLIQVGNGIDEDKAYADALGVMK